MFKLFTGWLVLAGYRNNDGTVNNAGSNGNYWSSTVNGSNAHNLNFNSGNADMNSNNRANGFSVRCLRIDGSPSSWNAGGAFCLPSMAGKPSLRKAGVTMMEVIGLLSTPVVMSLIVLVCVPMW